MNDRSFSSTAFIVFLICVPSCSEFNSTTNTPVSPPVLSIESRQVDFGKIEFAESHELRQIVIRNAGGQPLKLHEIGLSCNCLEAKPLQDVIEPRDETKIQIAVDRRRLGPQQAEITIRSNDPNNPQQRVHFKWVCSKKVEFAPAAIDFEILQPGEYIEKEIRLIGAEAVDAELVVGERNASSIQILREEGHSKYAVILVAPEISGQYYDELRLISKGGESLGVMPIRWSVVSPVEVTPRFALLRKDAESGHWIAELQVKCASAAAKCEAQSVKGKADTEVIRFELGQFDEQNVAPLAVYLSATDN